MFESESGIEIDGVSPLESGWEKGPVDDLIQVEMALAGPVGLVGKYLEMGRTTPRTAEGPFYIEGLEVHQKASRRLNNTHHVPGDVVQGSNRDGSENGWR